MGIILFKAFTQHFSMLIFPSVLISNLQPFALQVQNVQVVLRAEVPNGIWCKHVRWGMRFRGCKFILNKLVLTLNFIVESCQKTIVDGITIILMKARQSATYEVRESLNRVTLWFWKVDELFVFVHLLKPVKGLTLHKNETMSRHCSSGVL